MLRTLALLALGFQVQGATIVASHDAYVEKGMATTNFGNSGGLIIKDADDAGTTRKVYLLFDLTSITQPLLSAELRMSTSLNNGGSGNPNPTQKTIDVFTADSLTVTFDESSINWNNAPNNSTGGDGFSNVTTLVNDQMIPANAPPDLVTFSSSSLLDYLNDEIANGDKLALFILRRHNDNAGHNLSFHSSENSSVGTNGIIAPTLELTVVPEPPTASVGLLAALCLALRRSRGS